MLILAIDTAGAAGSVALAECGRDFRLLEMVPLAGGTYSAQLMPQIAALLARHHVAKHAIDALAAASGPGSFTGLRVGLSAVKALAEALNKPVAAVSLLEALAWAAPEGHVMAVLDAGRGQVFVGEYMARAGALPKLLREALLTLDEFAAEASARSEAVFTPDPKIAAALGARGHALDVVARPQSDVIARIGAIKIAAGQLVSPEALDANYIRRSDAEIFSRK